MFILGSPIFITSKRRKIRKQITRSRRTKYKKIRIIKLRKK